LHVESSITVYQIVVEHSRVYPNGSDEDNEEVIEWANEHNRKTDKAVMPSVWTVEVDSEGRAEQQGR
jgi:hypothetical protein